MSVQHAYQRKRVDSNGHYGWLVSCRCGWTDAVPRWPLRVAYAWYVAHKEAAVARQSVDS